MSCLVTAGRLEKCKEYVGGLYKVWFANFETIYAYQQTDNWITDLSGYTASTNTIENAANLYEYELKGTSSLVQNIASNRDNGTTMVTQTLILDLKGADQATNNEIKLLAYGRPHVFVQDNTGSIYMCGKLRGMDVTSGDLATGAAYGDKYGYNITMVGMENEYAPFVMTGTTMFATPFSGLVSAVVYTGSPTEGVLITKGT